jgi:hypothetical protein
MKTLKLIIVGLIIPRTGPTAQTVNFKYWTPPVRVLVRYSNVDYYILPDVQSYYWYRVSNNSYIYGRGSLRYQDIFQGNIK